ncbi:C-Jun-amino-terminal kinase-interacting protein [Homalodisca vitripennis]|nr:C-Jun-amino-terminal kinase-interacting protein [Homalodisca vitripennis]
MISSVQGILEYPKDCDALTGAPVNDFVKGAGPRPLDSVWPIRSNCYSHCNRIRGRATRLFSNLFSPNERGGIAHRKPLPYGNIRYNAPTHHISPALDTMRKRSMSDRKRGLDLIDSGDLPSEEEIQALFVKEELPLPVVPSEVDSGFECDPCAEVYLSN